MVLLELQNISYYRANKSILKNISFKVDVGDYFSIVGPSGSGKTTFLKLCAHLLNPTHGVIFLNRTFFNQRKQLI